MKGHRTLNKSFARFSFGRALRGIHKGHARAFAKEVGIGETAFSRVLNQVDEAPPDEVARKLAESPANVPIKHWSEP